MGETFVLVHGSASGSTSWGQVSQGLEASGARVFAPDMLGYGKAPAPGAAYGIAEEVAHLRGLINARGITSLHLVAHSVGAMFALHLRRALGPRVTRLTLVDPVVVSVLREGGESAGYAEMQAQYDGFMTRLPDAAAAARSFIDHWNGAGAWETLGERARAAITALAPKIRLEMIEARTDPTHLAVLAESPPPATILVGEKTRLAAVATARQLQHALRASMIQIPGAAHMIPVTHAAQVVAALER